MGSATKLLLVVCLALGGCGTLANLKSYKVVHDMCKFTEAHDLKASRTDTPQTQAEINGYREERLSECGPWPTKPRDPA